LKYVSQVKKLPVDAHYCLVRTENEAEASTTPLRAHPLTRVRDYSKRELILFKVGP